jgi:hypothetical protein
MTSDVNLVQCFPSEGQVKVAVLILHTTDSSVNKVTDSELDDRDSIPRGKIFCLLVTTSGLALGPAYPVGRPTKILYL